MREDAIRPIPATFAQLANKLAGHSINPLKVVSLFSGCGGMDLGFCGGFDFGKRYYDRLPYEIVWANDFNAAACDTYKVNLQHGILEGDVTDALLELPPRADVVIGGFPCQDVSINGKLAGAKGTRTVLYKYMVDVINRVQPQAFIAENVKGLTQAHAKEFFGQMLSELEATGYTVTFQLYLAADFGVPQMRERVFIVGTKDVPFAHPTPTLRPEQRMTVKQAIGDLEVHDESPDMSHIWSKAARSPDQGSRALKADVPSTTIRAEHHGNTQWHYALDRRISLREAARLQSFPDSFRFTGGMRECERQIGNAVPPVLAWHIARELYHHLAG